MGCSSSDSLGSSTDPGSRATNGGGAAEQRLEFVNNLQEPGAVQGLNSVIDLHRRKHPNLQFVNTSLDFDQYVALPSRIAAGDPPDVVAWQANDLAALGPLLALNDFLKSESQADFVPNMYWELFDEVTVAGEIHALPWLVHRGNTLVYNRAIFTAHNLKAPSTIPEFRTVCQSLQAAGVTPIGGYGLAQLLADLVAGVLGPKDYCSFANTGKTSETAIRQAVALFAEVFNNNYYDRDTLFFAGNPAGAEATAIMDGSAATLSTIDWIQAPLQELGWTAGVDFGLLPAPGTAGLFTFTTLVLAIPRDAPHRQAALDFLSTAGSLAGHNAFYASNLGNSSRKDVDMSIFDVERRGFIADMKEAISRCPMKLNWRNWEMPLVPLTATKPVDQEAVLQVILTYP